MDRMNMGKGEKDMGDPTSQDPSFIFVIGASRSGNTMVARMLGKHPQIYTFKELHFFDQLWARNDMSESPVRLAGTLYSIQRKGYRKARDVKTFRPAAEELVNGMTAEESGNPALVYRRFLLSETQCNGKRNPCEHTPSNVFYIDEIFRYFPDARIINMVRDPRGVLLSQKNRWRRRAYGNFDLTIRHGFRQKINYHPVTMAKLWSSSVRAARRHAADGRILTLHFEWCVEDGERLVRALCGFLDVPYAPEMLNVPLVGSSLLPDRGDQTGIDASRASAWRDGGLTLAEIRLCQLVARRELLAAGYEVVSVRGGRTREMILLAVWPLQTLIVFACNFRSFNHLLDSLRRRLNPTAGRNRASFD